MQGSEAHEIVIGKGQPEYLPLPAIRSADMVTCRFRLTWRERLAVAIGGNLWLQQMAFARPFQPVMIHTEEPTSI